MSMSDGKSLKDRVFSLQNTLLCLALRSGSIQVRENRVAREFYEKWLALNDECIRSRTFRVDTTGFVSYQLRLLLANWCVDITEINLYRVFSPAGGGAAGFLFGDYLFEIGQVG
jgi:hypothetical protein